MSKHNKRFPNELDNYRQARNELLDEEIKLRAQVEKIGQLRKALPNGGKLKEDYQFQTLSDQGEEKAIPLSSLFTEGKNTLALYSFMYSSTMDSPCTSCTSIVDGWNGCADHMKDRLAIAIVAKSPIQRIQELATSRNWTKLNFVSSEKNTYNTDYFAENEDGFQMPVLNIFRKTDEGIFHFYASELLYCDLNGHPRHVDQLWPIWNMFDMTPEGRGEDWFPKLEY